MAYQRTHVTIARIAALAALAPLALPATARAQAAGLNLPDIAPPGHNPVLYEIGASTSADRIETYLTALVGFGTRHTASDTVSDTRGIGAARRWIHSEFERISADCGGCLDVFYVGDVVEAGRLPGPTRVVNVVAVQRGTTDPNRYILMGGHYDSRNSDGGDAEGDAPGAVDDGSGTVATIEAARVLSQYDFDASLVYVGFAGEEQGLLGAEILARHALENGWDIEAVLSNDIVGNTQGLNGAYDNLTVRVFSEGIRADETERMGAIRRSTGGEVDSPSRNLARYIETIADQHMRTLDVMMIYRQDRFGRGGDHRAFNALGFPAVRFSETHEDYDHQHQDIRTEDGVFYGDVLAEAEFGYIAKVAGLNAATMASLAWAPPPPTDVDIDDSRDRSPTLAWEAIDPARAPDLAGYKVYWRTTTSPTWENSIFVGDRTEYTVQDLIIDNLFFGVASVSEDGFESPIVFPGPLGEFTPASRQATEGSSSGGGAAGSPR
ncbi:MAG: M28 family metallopeptidase [Longimicrobiales bacterium]